MTKENELKALVTKLIEGEKMNNEKEEREKKSNVRSEAIKDEIIAVLKKYDVAIGQVGNWFTAIEQKIGYIKL